MSTILLGFEPDTLDQEYVEKVKALAPDYEIVVTRDTEEIQERLPEIEIVAGSFPRDLLDQATNLRWLQQWGAGADWLLRYPEAAEMDFVLTNASGVHAVPISEHIFALMLAFARRLCEAVRAQAKHEWARPNRGDVVELAEKTMVLIGVGAIGERTARLAAAMDMHVLGVRRHPEKAVPGVAQMFGPDKLLDVLAQADYIVLTVPLTPETRNMIDEEALQAMKPSSYIVNIGRGGTIQEDALIRALREGWIAGAGLDVFETEPLPEDSPLWDLDNVIITPHYSGRTPRYHERAMAIFLDNLHRYVGGQEMRNVVDKELGY
jgi:phosphoglycerate dehydrogenase-like enzyme